MHVTAERLEFAPPPTKGLVRAVGLAIVAHALLLAMLTVGVHWKRDATPVTVEAELWSAVPQEAAPPPAPPPPPPEPTPEPPKPVVQAPPAPTPPLPDPTIAIVKEKARLQKEKELQQQRLEQERLAKAKLEQDKKLREAQKQKQLQEEKAAREREQREKLARDKKQQEQQKQQDAKAAAAEAKKLAEMRQQQIDRALRMAGQAEGSGSADSRGTAAKSSGPSASYGGRIKARVKPNITYTDTPVGNPTAEVEVRTSPDGTIISRKLVKSSGVKSWDDAVLNALDKTEVLPRDVDGRVPSPLLLVFSPRD